MKYSIGDKVRVKSKVWYDEMLSIPSKLVWRNKLTDEFAGIWCGSKVFYVDMCKFCGNVMTIQNIGIDHYIMEEDSCGYEFTDEMIEDVVMPAVMPKFKVGDKICRVLCGLSNGYLVTSVSDEYYGLQMGEGNVGVLPVAEQDEWVLLSAGDKKIEGLVEEEMPLDKAGQITDFEYEGLAYTLPEGYQFVDENGNVIETKKIVLEKKKPKYPQSYEECCRVVNANGYIRLVYNLSDGQKYYHDEDNLYLYENFRRLKICRDAYWTIYGEENSLGKPWEPDWTIDDVKYSIFTIKGMLSKTRSRYDGAILSFPTEEMRDAFYENFKKEIEICKELL